MMPNDADLDLLRAFEQGLDPQHPERSRIPARVLGYGEISTVFEIQAEGMHDLAFKRLPLFKDTAEVERYQVAYEEYVRLLSDEIGLNLPAHAHAVVPGATGLPVFYIIQQQIPAGAIGHHALHRLEPEDVCLLVQRVLQELHKVWAFGRDRDGLHIAIDGQISNWAVDGFDPDAPDLAGARLAQAKLWYLDTSTPLFRVDGVEQLDPELFLRSAPAFLAWILRLFFVQDVVDRYYDPHLVAVDIAANFYKEQRSELIPGVVGVIGDFFGSEAAGLGVAPVTEDEVRAYYREDALIWTLYLSMRQIDQFLRVRLLRRAYPYILPPKIQR